MTQVILNGWPMPEVSRDNYSCYEEDLSVQVDMISGRRVVETRGKVWKLTYSYDYMGNETMRNALAVLRAGGPFLVQFLPDDREELITSSFLVEDVSNPVMAFSRNDRAYWHKISFTLREENPHS